MKLVERRIRIGRYEYRCSRCARWYWRIAVHIHRYHRAKCMCLAHCAVTLKTGGVMLRPSVYRKRLLASKLALNAEYGKRALRV